MYRGGLIWNVVAQTVMALVWFIRAGVADSIFGTVGSSTGLNDTVNDFNNLNGASITNTLSDVNTGVVAAFVVLGILNVIGIVLNSLALSNLKEAESGRVDFKSGLGTAAGIFALFTNFIGGILVLVGITSEKDRLNGNPRSRSHNSYDNRRDDYRQGRSDDFDRRQRDDRRDSYRREDERDDRRDSYRREDERDDYGRGR